MISELPLHAILRVLFSLPDLELRPETEFTQIPGWDSLSQINLIFAVEQEFQVRFTDDELEHLRQLTTLGELQAAVDEKRLQAG